MKEFMIVLISLAFIAMPIKQLSACTSPNTGEKRANLYCFAGCDFDQPQRPIWTCTAASGTYKIHVGVTTAGAGGWYGFEVYDRTNSQSILQRDFQATGTCSTGDFTVDLVNGHQYELWVDAFSTAGCTVGEHAWVKMCYQCQGS